MQIYRKKYGNQYICELKSIDMPANLNILITNDDGYTSKGIRELMQMLREFGNVTVVAPTTAQSGKSASISDVQPQKAPRAIWNRLWLKTTSFSPVQYLKASR